jgi:membrane protease YdiL (CAAX protease family)
MDLDVPRKLFLIGLPVLLLASTALAFTALAFATQAWQLGRDLGYVLGFAFYDLAWCILAPLLLLGGKGFLGLFSERVPLFSKENWLPATLLVITTVVAAVMYWDNIANIASTPVALILIGIPVTIINSTCEEILWRGMYARAFPNRLFLGFIYPSIGFALWHISPQLVMPSEGGMLPFVVSTFFLGLVYGWAAYRTGSARWTALSHSLNGILTFGAPLSTTILALVSP